MESSLVESALDFEISIFFLIFHPQLDTISFDNVGVVWNSEEKKKSRKLKLPPPRSFPLGVAWDAFTETSLLEELQPRLRRDVGIEKGIKITIRTCPAGPDSNCLAVFRLSVQYPVLAKAR